MMRVIHLTAGTGSFHCGTCIRDNALVSELQRQGHVALMAPMYLPMVLDEPPATGDAPLFYGGVNVYLQHRSRLFRRTPRWVDAMLDAPGVLRAAAARAGMTTARDLAELTLSTLRGEEGRQGKELERLTAWLSAEEPDVVCLSNALLIGLARRIRQRTSAAVVCTLQGEDAFLDSFPEALRAQAWETLHERAADVDAFLSISRYYGDLMRQRARLPAGKVHVVYPGILLDGYAPAEAPPEPPVLGYLARMRPAKGLGLLAEAYVLLRRRERIPGLRLHVAGSCTAGDREFVREVRARLEQAGVADRVEFHANLDRDAKIAFLRGLSVLSVPTTYGESFGLYVIEALAAGVPVVQPRHAAFPEVIEATGGGLLCEPDEAESLAQRIEELLADPARARAMGLRGREVVRARFSVGEMVRGTLDVFRQALAARSATGGA